MINETRGTVPGAPTFYSVILSFITSSAESNLYFWVFLLCGLVTLELLFGKKYRTLGIMERLAAKWKQTMTIKSNNKTEGRGTREGASSLVYI